MFGWSYFFKDNSGPKIQKKNQVSHDFYLVLKPIGLFDLAFLDHLDRTFLIRSLHRCLGHSTIGSGTYQLNSLIKIGKGKKFAFLGSKV